MELIIILVAVYLGYIFILKPFVIRPFQEGLKREGNNEYKKINSKNRINHYQPKETQDIQSKKKGDDFEGFIAKKIDQNKCFKIQEWRSDKYINGIYAKANHYPDFEIEFSMNNISRKFAIECKYRSANRGDIQIAKFQNIKNYHDYSNEKNIPVFIVLGLSGVASNPNEFYIISLDNIVSEIMDYNYLQKFRKFDIENGFYFDHILYQLK